MPPRKNKRGDRGSIEDEPRNSKKSNMAAEENIDVEEPDERLNEQEEPSLFEIKALLVDIQTPNIKLTDTVKRKTKLTCKIHFLTLINIHACFILQELKLVKKRCILNSEGRKLCRNLSQS